MNHTRSLAFILITIALISFIISSCKKLMHVALMTRIVYHLVAGKVHHPYQGGGNFHDAQIGSQVATGFGNTVHQELANLVAKYELFLLGKVLSFDFPKIGVIGFFFY